MRWLVSAIGMVMVCVPGAAQQGPDCVKSEAACVLDAAWSAALVLPEEKQQRLAPAFLEVAALSGEGELIAKWEGRFGQSVSVMDAYPDYGWHKAGPILKESGVEGLIKAARDRSEPLSFGRADALLSAGKRLMQKDPAGSKRVNQAMLDLTRSASAFEKPNLAHASAELAMHRCDRNLLETSLSFTDAPDNLRYAFWRARLSGDARALLSDIRDRASEEDTREVRRVLDGYRAILELGYCTAPKSEIGG